MGLVRGSHWEVNAKWVVPTRQLVARFVSGVEGQRGMTATLTAVTASPGEGLHAFVVIDSVIGGRSMGGTRMTAGVTVEEVADLARKMTLKLALAGIPIGGAKAGIVCDLPDGPSRDRVLEAFGRRVSVLLHGGVYLGTDQGISYRDREVFLRAAGYDVGRLHNVGLPCSWAELWRHCEDITGFGICEAIAAMGAGHRAPTVAIQGFGTVGRAVAEILDARAHVLVAVSDREGTVWCPGGLPVAALVACTDVHGTIDRTRLPAHLERSDTPDALFDVDADMLVLAAVRDSIDSGNADRVRARLVVEGGNIACSAPAHRRLAERGVVVLPDIVVNCGGAAVTGLVLSGAVPRDLGLDQLVRWFHQQVADRVRANVAGLMSRAAGDGGPLAEVAERMALENMDRLSPRTEAMADAAAAELAGP